MTSRQFEEDLRTAKSKRLFASAGSERQFWLAIRLVRTELGHW